MLFIYFNPYLRVESEFPHASVLQAFKGFAILGGILYVWSDEEPRVVKSENN